MRKHLIAFAAVAALSACTAAQLQQGQTLLSTGIAAACTDVNAALALNPGSASAPWAKGACGSASQIAGLVQNSATLQWLGQMQAQLAAPAAS